MDPPLKRGRKESLMRDETAKLLLAQRVSLQAFLSLDTGSGYLTDLICLLFRYVSGQVKRKGTKDKEH